MEEHYCNFQRIEDGERLSVRCDTYEVAEKYARDIVDAPVINISVTQKPLYETGVKL